jgi:hypothetical protein
MQGLGTSTTTTTARDKKRRGRRPPEYKKVFEHPQSNMDIYTITAELLAVNGIESLLSSQKKIREIIDRNQDLLIKPKGPVRIVKTSPANNIFINVLKVFRKK